LTGHSVDIEADSVDELFFQVGAAFAEHIRPPVDGSADRLPILLAGTDLGTLLEHFLEDLAYLAECEGFAARRVERVRFENGEVRAAVSGRTAAFASPPPIAPAAWNVTVLDADDRLRARLVVLP
jgi:SHS2 domain-containing protein